MWPPYTGFMVHVQPHCLGDHAEWPAWTPKWVRNNVVIVACVAFSLLLISVSPAGPPYKPSPPVSIATRFNYSQVFPVILLGLHVVMSEYCTWWSYSVTYSLSCQGDRLPDRQPHPSTLPFVCISTMCAKDLNYSYIAAASCHRKHVNFHRNINIQHEIYIYTCKNQSIFEMFMLFWE